MRPNRIGVYPAAMNTIANGGSHVDIGRIVGQGVAGARTAIGTIELFGGSNEVVFDTILSQQIVSSVDTGITLTGSAQRFSIGGFLNASGIRSVNADPQPLYVRFVGHCHCSVFNDVIIQPVFGIKDNEDPPNSTGDSDSNKESRRLAFSRAVIPSYIYRGANSVNSRRAARQGLRVN